MQLSLLSVLLAVASHTLADVEVTSPPAGKSVAAGTIQIAWKDSGKAPSISDLTTYSINLCAGGNEQDTFSCTLATLQSGGTFAEGSQASGDVPAAAGDNSGNGYFLQFVSTSASGTVTNYGPRFGLKGMTGKFTPQVQNGIAAAGTKSKDGPPTENDATQGQTAGASGPFGMPYSMQTGLTKYAPMQPQPPTKITKKTASPQYPPSNAPIAQTYLPIPSQVTTMTQSRALSVSSMENSASPLPNPRDDMQKFLNRWKD